MASAPSMSWWSKKRQRQQQPDHDLALMYHRPLAHPPLPQDGYLGIVDDRRRESAADGPEVVIVKVPPCNSLMSSFRSSARAARSTTSSAIWKMLLESAASTLGTTSPVGVSTAMPML